MFIPKSVKTIGQNAFTFAQTGLGHLESFIIEDGTEFTGVSIFDVPKEAEVSVNNSTREVNTTFKEIHIPASMPNFLSSLSIFDYASQLRNLYIGDVELNDDFSDENYGTIYCKNYPLFKLYTDSNKTSFSIVFESALKEDSVYDPYADADGSQYYCPKFYHDICIYIGKYTADTSLYTTEKYSVCPIGYKGNGKGYTTNINLGYVRSFNNNVNYKYLTDEEKANMPQLQELSRENLLRLIAGLEPRKNTISITLPLNAPTLTAKDRDIFQATLGINFKLQNLIY